MDLRASVKLDCATANLLLRYVGIVGRPVLQLVIIAGFGRLTVGRNRHLEDADHLIAALIRLFQRVLPFIFTDTLETPGSPFIGASVPFSFAV